MGGFGSGRSLGTSKKDSVEDCNVLNVDKLARDRILYPGLHTFGTLTWTDSLTREEVSSCGYEVNTLGLYASWFRIIYTLTQTGEKSDCTILLTTTRPHFGGFRWWFMCPRVIEGVHCNRRVGRLYLPPGGKYYGCRVCYDLTYTSCQDSHKFDQGLAFLAQEWGTTPATANRLIRWWRTTPEAIELSRAFSEIWRGLNPVGWPYTEHIRRKVEL